MLRKLGSAVAQTSSLIPIKVGYVPYSGIGAFRIGIDRGIFKKHGLDVEVTEGAAPAPLIAQVVSGKLQFSYSTVPALVGAERRWEDDASKVPDGPA